MTDDGFTHDPRDSRDIPGGAPTSFEKAKRAVDDGDADGLGFVITRHDPFLVIEVANGCAEDALPDDLKPILSGLGMTFAEEGDDDLLRLFYKGALPDGADTGDPVVITIGGDIRDYVFRVFSSGWTPVTGRHIAGTPEDLQAVDEDTLRMLFEKAGAI